MSMPLPTPEQIKQAQEEENRQRKDKGLPPIHKPKPDEPKK